MKRWFPIEKALKYGGPPTIIGRANKGGTEFFTVWSPILGRWSGCCSRHPKLLPVEWRWPVAGEVS